MSTAAELLTGIGEAADDLGYRVALVEPDRVVLEPREGPPRYAITIEGAPRYSGRVIVDGEGIRKVLRSLSGPKCNCECCK